MKSLARFISFITNPALILFPVPYLLILRFGYGHLLALKWTLFSLLFLAVAGLFVYHEVRHHVFSDMDVSKREQRPFLFMILGGISLIYFLSLFILHAPPILFISVWGVMVGLIITTLVTLKIKASIHVGALTAVLLTLVKLYNLPYALFLLIPIVAWARITIKRHTLAETIAGFFLGTALTVLMYILLKYTQIFPL